MHCHLAKNMGDFWAQWNRKFSKRTKCATNINGYYDIIIIIIINEIYIAQVRKSQCN